MINTQILIDSRYRDFSKYSNESKFTINFESIYKNILAVRLETLELTNTINYISSTKGNNYVTLHLPDVINDPIGIKISLENTQLQHIDSIKTLFNSLITEDLLNISLERYFYIFYLNDNCIITFDFNDTSNPISLATPLTIYSGWYSMYGLVILIQNYIQTKYNERVSSNNGSSINLDSGHFTINSFTLNIFDKRFINDIRVDTISGATYSSGLSINLTQFKSDLYEQYVSSNTFIPSNTGSGILDNLIDSKKSIYYINNVSGTPTNNVLYNISMSVNTNTLKVSFSNNYDGFYYTSDDWTTIEQFTKSNILNKDIAPLQINFNTQGSTQSSFTNNIININSLTYPSLGYYLGYRLLNNNFTLSSVFNETLMSSILTATKNHNTFGEDYIFLKINNWGDYDFFNEPVYSKIYLRSPLYTATTFINKVYHVSMIEYVFPKITNISKLDIELVDYLGKTVELNGTDFSLTLSLRHTDKKTIM